MCEPVYLTFPGQAPAPGEDATEEDEKAWAPLGQAWCKDNPKQVWEVPMQFEFDPM